MLPILIFLNTFCAIFDVSRTNANSPSEETYCFDQERYGLFIHLTEEEFFLMTLVCVAPALLITFSDHKKLNKWYRCLCTGFGIFSIFCCLLMSTRRVLQEVIYKGPFVWCGLRVSADLWEILQKCLVEAGGFILNVTIMVKLGADPWTEPNEDEEDNFISDFYVQTLKKYSKWVIKCHLIILTLCTATIFTNFIHEIFFTFVDSLGPHMLTIAECNPDRIIWILILLGILWSGLYQFRSYTKKYKNVIQNILDKQEV